MDSRGAPERIGRGHAGDEGLDLGVDRRTAQGGPARALGPVRAEQVPVPPQDGVGGDDHEGLPPPGPDSGQPDPPRGPSLPQSRGGNQWWQPARKSLSQLTWLQPSQG